MTDANDTTTMQAREIIANGCGCHRVCEYEPGDDCGCAEDARKVLALIPNRASTNPLPALPDDDKDFTPDLARKIIAQYQEIIRRLTSG